MHQNHIKKQTNLFDKYVPLFRKAIERMKNRIAISISADCFVCLISIQEGFTQLKADRFQNKLNYEYRCTTTELSMIGSVVYLLA